MEKLKNNKKILIICGVVILVGILVILFFVLKNNGNKSLSNSSSNKPKNEIVNKETHTYGNTYEHNSNNGVIATDDENWYFAGTGGITKQAKKDILQFHTDTKIFNAPSLYLNLYEDYIYFLDTDNNTIYRIDKSGNNREEIADSIKSFYIVDDYIYYTKYSGEYKTGIYRMTVNGDNEELLLDYSISKFYIYGKTIYYTAGDNVLAISDLNGDNQEIIIKDVNDFKILDDNNIFYEDTVDNNTVYVLHSDLSTEKITGTGTYATVLNLDSIILNKDYILYLPPNSSSFKYRAVNKNYLWTFMARQTDDRYFVIRGGNKLADFEIIDHTLCTVSDNGGSSYINTEGSDFKNEEKMKEDLGID